MQPLIGINGTLVAGGPGELPMFGIRTSYIDAVCLAGGIPLLLPAACDNSVIQRHAELCDGYVFVGGPDLNPARYCSDPVHPTCSLAPERRENYDLALIDAVLTRRKPFLAVCMGCQEVNVVLGGTLIQDIASQTGSKVQHSIKQAPHFLRQEVVVEAGTLLAELVGAGPLNANSAHHQAVDKPGRGVRINSRCPVDGIIESYELEDYPFGLALQWHPEMLVHEEAHLKLFQGLVNAAVAAKEHTELTTSTA